MSTAPSLISEDIEQTNTLALLLPHLALFEGPQLRLLKEHYSQFGNIVHWAPVKGFGRVIIVYATDEEAALAKKEGDRLFLDVDLGEDVGRKRGHQRSASQPAHGYVSSLLSCSTCILARSSDGDTGVMSMVLMGLASLPSCWAIPPNRTAAVTFTHHSFIPSSFCPSL
jgi:hypothetical protein